MDRLLAGGDAADLTGFLAGAGWALKEEAVEALAGRYGRDLADPFAEADHAAPAAEPPWLDTMFLSAAFG